MLRIGGRVGRGVTEVDMRVCSDEQVAEALDVDAAIRSQRLAFESLGRGEAQLAEKVAMRTGDDTTLSYLSRLSPEHGAVSKLVAVHPGNAAEDLPAISATVLVLDAATGRTVAVMAATALTELRTAAGSAVAADALAPPSADELAVIGSGVQARAHVRAIARVRRLREVRIFSRDPRRRESAAAELSAELGLAVRAVGSAAEAVRSAPVVVTCTLSAQPVVPTDRIEAGATVLSVGSFEPHRREVDELLVRRAGAVVVDDVATAASHAGPVVHALERGDITRDRLRSLGEVLLGRAPGRTSEDEVVFFNSVGLGVQDAAAAHAVLGTL
ncbi:ornithine cyclodeaminase family protein [Saccharopolyspora erythraea]|uniref:ornithine cyclodeaminase family protein n=1 Tax=Saccharopolyspora erythraea TaxID=1836 RepID=UPI001BA46102|nr:ornithine cyclodeaminase family protein [Saccharopolyspora erythraea]QUH02703.1 ornithine cyclodeaminase family protein [Saccharopolyspora erythraea]